MAGAGWLVSEGNFRGCPPRGAGCLVKGAVVWGVKHVRSLSSAGPSHFEDSCLCFEAAVEHARLCLQRRASGRHARWRWTGSGCTSGPG